MPAIRSFIASIAPRAMLAAVTAVSIGTAVAIAAESSGLRVIFFRSVASVSDNNEGTMVIQGRIFTPAQGMHAALVALAARQFKVKPTDQPFRYRARLFFSDSKRGARVSVKLGERTVDLPASDPSGYFSDAVPLTAADWARAKSGVIAFESVPSTTGGHTVRGEAIVVPRDAIVVVTDMDDTIKDTRILDPVLRERNTMVNVFKPVPGMTQVYRGWQAAPGALVHFHVVSAGPWQLYEPLSRFTAAEKFPPFTWDMRPVDIGFDPWVAMSELHPTDEKPFNHKVGKIRALLKLLPNQVVLVGDSGEMDPEVYAEIVKSCPNRVNAVFIRDVPGARAREYDTLFRSESGVKAQRFRDATAIPTTLTPLKAASASQCR